MVNIVEETSVETLAKVRGRAEEAHAMQAVADSFDAGVDEAREVASDDDEDEDDDDDDENALEFVAGPTVWEAAADEEIPENHWDYHMRKNMNDGRGDSVARNLSYVPVCNCMPVCSGEDGCRNPYFMWTKKK